MLSDLYSYQILKSTNGKRFLDAEFLLLKLTCKTKKILKATMGFLKYFFK